MAKRNVTRGNSTLLAERKASCGFSLRDIAGTLLDRKGTFQDEDFDLLYDKIISEFGLEMADTAQEVFESEGYDLLPGDVQLFVFALATVHDERRRHLTCARSVH